MTIASHSRAYQATRPVGSWLCDWRRKDCQVRKFLWTGIFCIGLGNIGILFSSTWTASLSTHPPAPVTLHYIVING